MGQKFWITSPPPTTEHGIRTGWMDVIQEYNLTITYATKCTHLKQYQIVQQQE